MFLFTLSARPKPENDKIGSTIKGASVRVWVDFAEVRAAEVVAKYYVDEAGWIPETRLKSDWVEQGDYLEGDELKQYYAEALEDGSCLLFDAWSDKPGDGEAELGERV